MGIHEENGKIFNKTITQRMGYNEKSFLLFRLTFFQLKIIKLICNYESPYIYFTLLGY